MFPSASPRRHFRCDGRTTRLALVLILAAATAAATAVAVVAPVSPTGVHRFALARESTVAIDKDETIAGLTLFNATNLFNCGISFGALDESQIQFRIHLLSPRIIKPKSEPENSTAHSGSEHVVKVDVKEIRLNNIDLLYALQRSDLDPNRPFVFLMNGFNHDGSFENSWMYNVGVMLARAQLNRTNVVVFTWTIPSLVTTNIFNVVPAYYKTVANYGTLVNYVAYTVLKVIQYVDIEKFTRGVAPLVAPKISDQLTVTDSSLRNEHFNQFEFYAHSLGSHIVSDAVILVKKSHKDLKFNKVVGLDPAEPCFLGDHYGISAARMANLTNNVVVIHSNAGFAGVASERGKVEIVLNGGTFQPGCAWYNFPCHHSRSTDIFTYLDKSCQMVAYKCKRFEQFKIGACETCDALSSPEEDDKNDMSKQGCVLVNLPEQSAPARGWSHQVNRFGAVIAKRRLADEAYVDESYLDIEDSTSSNGIEAEQWPRQSRSTHRQMKRRSLIRLISDDRFKPREADEKSHYYYTLTNPNYNLRTSKSHCLQHYQIRLIAFAQNSTARDKCPLSSSHISNSHLSVQLFEQQSSMQNSSTSDPIAKPQTPFLFLDTDWGNRGNPVSERSLTDLADGFLHTGLFTFEGEPVLFDRAVIRNVDFATWSKCLSKKGILSTRFNFVMDIAFMSHTDPKIRHSYSTVLCGSWLAGDEKSQLLYLDLCRSSQITQVSDRIDEFLVKIDFDGHYDTWTVNLLNSIASLFFEWRPFR